MFESMRVPESDLKERLRLIRFVVDIDMDYWLFYPHDRIKSSKGAYVKTWRELRDAVYKRAYMRFERGHDQHSFTA